MNVYTCRQENFPHKETIFKCKMHVYFTPTVLFRVDDIKLQDAVGLSVKPQQTILLLKLICDK